jgi:tetratricopeptide (TPR) repeat protein
LSRVNPPFTRVVAVLALTSALALAGCQKTGTTAENTSPPASGNETGAGGMPPGHPPLQGMSGMTDAQGPTDAHEIALKQTGINSAEELNRALAKLADASLREDFEMAFRYSFSARQAQRNYPTSVDLANKVARAEPNFAPAYRVLGYALFNTGEPAQALNAYNKAVELDPNYGEAHYALAFMYAMGDPASGVTHYRKAMELGVPDERNLGTRFYSGQ